MKVRREICPKEQLTYVEMCDIIRHISQRLNLYSNYIWCRFFKNRNLQRFEYARYMGIETFKTLKEAKDYAKFEYARYMGIETQQWLGIL